ncbi:radical SAM protein [Paludibacterium purpuratum]|nr:radical SAM protein [Paludibacterium purpuratum]
MARGGSPALDWIVLKVAQRCNLNCTYCYVYNRGDDSWKSRPALISDVVVAKLAERIVAHCAQYGLDAFVVELHGGEPLLLGKKRMQRLIDMLRQRCAPVRLRLILQTNGLLLDPEWLELFDRNGISFGISLDGPPEVADRFRIMRNGQGSTQKLLDKIRALRAAGPDFNRLMGSILCVVNPDLDGGKLVHWFVDNGFDAFEFLLPDGNYVNYPQGWRGVEPYRRFLLEAFEAWYAMGSAAPQIRLFEMMMMGFMGIKSPLDALGGDLRRLCVVESDGSIGVSDVVRICRGEYANDKLDIFQHPLDLHASVYRLAQIQQPCAQCQACPHFASCGGGYLPHRFDGAGFDHPSIYCHALYALSERMLSVIRRDLPPTLLSDPTTSLWTASLAE